MKKIFEELKNGLVVSCQSEGDDPFNSPEGVTLFARAAEMGGAKGIRSEGIEKTKSILANVKLPVIGLIKSQFEDGSVKITGSFRDFESLLEIGCHIIAVDGTFRIREGLSGPKFISQLKKRYNALIMADIATYDEAIACVDSGADCVSTTLSGYTPETRHLNNNKPDFDLLRKLVNNLRVPVFAEGRYNTPEFCAEAIKIGAWSVVVGTAITRPRIVTSWFVSAIENASLERTSENDNSFDFDEE
ncbi:MAG: N-acetylmannosamine-6-phosphate 2-epimerase [Ignavibacteria bacterium]|jgi:N-acylglucosamine-6-phosphate 2-epimerase|nr:N-acetylmannosamine-6-phosphate 2-epimerase [Ignavibacteria bacterium]MDH7528084.1 N-acetylmannosamine-6-phosphate 2-epimerase [Ignavibacteria bacterium]